MIKKVLLAVAITMGLAACVPQPPMPQVAEAAQLGTRSHHHVLAGLVHVHGVVANGWL